MSTRMDCEALTLTFRPQPIRTQLKTIRIGGQPASAIMRTWNPGETRRCKLCLACDAGLDTCLVIVNRLVAPAEAPTYSTREIPVQPAPTLKTFAPETPAE